jgi:hypothetical protein
MMKLLNVMTTLGENQEFKFMACFKLNKTLRKLNIQLNFFLKRKK